MKAPRRPLIRSEKKKGRKRERKKGKKAKEGEEKKGGENEEVKRETSTAGVHQMRLLHRHSLYH